MQDIWKPKKTLYDWGKTEYKVIRNWTPRPLEVTQRGHTPPPTEPPSSQDDDEDVFPSAQLRSHQPPATAASDLPNLSSQSGSNLEEVLLVDVPSERSQYGEQVDPMFETQYTEESRAANILTSIKPPASHQNTTTRPIYAHGPASLDQHLDIISDHSQLLISPDTGRVLKDRHTSTQSRIRNEVISSLNAVTASNTPSRDVETQETRLEENYQSPTISEDMVESELTSEKENSDKESEKFEGEVHRTLAADLLPKKTQKSKGKTRTRKSPTCYKDSLKVKLWHTKGVRRSKKDFNILDVCLTVYETVLRSTLEDCNDLSVQEVLLAHRKQTQKHILSEVRSVHNVSLLQTLQKKERLKQTRLQKEMSSTLTSLRKTCGKYQKALIKAKQAKRKEEENAVHEEVCLMTGR